MRSDDAAWNDAYDGKPYDDAWGYDDAPEYDDDAPRISTLLKSCIMSNVLGIFDTNLQFLPDFNSLSVNQFFLK